MSDSPAWGRYAELRPAELEQILNSAPIAYVPWGSLEWHGPHLPFGTEGFIAEEIAIKAARRTGGIVLPTTWWPVAPIPHRFSLGIRSETLHELWDGLFNELMRIGFDTVVVLTGHYGFGHDLVLMDAAEHAMAQSRLVVLAIPPLALVDERMLDHAAHWETSLLLALRPRLVELGLIDPYAADLSAVGVLGDDPRSATASQGESALRLATERIALSVQALRTVGGGEIVRELYIRRRQAYQEYVDRFFRGSWEDAAEAWWRDQRKSPPSQ